MRTEFLPGGPGHTYIHTRSERSRVRRTFGRCSRVSGPLSNTSKCHITPSIYREREARLGTVDLSRPYPSMTCHARHETMNMETKYLCLDPHTGGPRGAVRADARVRERGRRPHARRRDPAHASAWEARGARCDRDARICRGTTCAGVRATRGTLRRRVSPRLCRVL